MGFSIYLYSVLSFSGLVIILAAGLMIAERFLINYGICKLDINAGEKPLAKVPAVTASSQSLPEEAPCFLRRRRT
jgi:Na+-transporting NADH:ubiquinone oxidoreductase subunit NqrF